VVVEEVLEDVEHARHLREDEDAVLAAEELPQQVGHHLQLAAVVFDQALLRELHPH